MPHLEALVLASAKPEHSWDASELAHMLYIPLETARGVLLDLVGARLMVLTDAELLMARYSPTDSALGVAVGQLVEVYTRRVVEVTRLIHAHGGDDAQRLADAFRVRRKN